MTSPTTLNTVLRRPFSYQNDRKRNPLSFSAAGLPAGLTLNPQTV